MAGFDEIAKECAKALLKTSQKTREADKIAKRINNLVYSGSRERLTYEDKKEILHRIHFYLNNPPSNEEIFYVLLEKSDNKDFLSLISYINSQLVGNN